MHRYFIKTPWWVKRIFSRYIWHVPVTEQVVFLTFDDGPHPTITPWVLEQLAAYNAKATFFCIGQNVDRFSKVYRQVLSGGHSVGNHTHRHLNGWKTPASIYLNDAVEAANIIHSNLFRPPYGRIRAAQAKALRQKKMKIILWDVLSADFDNSFSPAQCTANVLRHATAGSVIVFHDSEKAFVNLQQTLPAVLEEFHRRGYTFSKLEMNAL